MVHEDIVGWSVFTFFLHKLIGWDLNLMTIFYCNAEHSGQYDNHRLLYARDDWLWLAQKSQGILFPSQNAKTLHNSFLIIDSYLTFIEHKKKILFAYLKHCSHGKTAGIISGQGHSCGDNVFRKCGVPNKQVRIFLSLVDLAIYSVVQVLSWCLNFFPVSL